MKHLLFLAAILTSFPLLGSPKSAIEFWNSYDAEKEPLDVCPQIESKLSTLV